MFDPTKESFTTEERQMVGDVAVTVRATVQGGSVVSGFFSVDPGAGLTQSKVKDVDFSKVVRRAMKDAPEEEEES